MIVNSWSRHGEMKILGGGTCSLSAATPLRAIFAVNDIVAATSPKLNLKRAKSAIGAPDHCGPQLIVQRFSSSSLVQRRFSLSNAPRKGIDGRWRVRVSRTSPRLVGAILAMINLIR